MSRVNKLWIALPSRLVQIAGSATYTERRCVAEITIRASSIWLRNHTYSSTANDRLQELDIAAFLAVSMTNEGYSHVHFLLKFMSTPRATWPQLNASLSQQEGWCAEHDGSRCAPDPLPNAVYDDCSALDQCADVPNTESSAVIFKEPKLLSPIVSGH